MSGIHVHVEQNVGIGGVVMAQLRGPFRGFPVSNARIGQPPGGQYVRIGLIGYISVWAV